MRWRYCFPHIWDDPRAVWEDVYLLPDGQPDGKESIWLTVDALGDPNDPTHGNDRPQFYAESLQKLGESDFFIDGADMIVRARDFTKSELVEWVKVWLVESGFPVSELVEADADEFAETNDHARVVAKAKRLKDECDSLEPPQTEQYSFSVWRLDDNGNEFKVKDVASEAEAEKLRDELESRGHKQTYWVRPNDA